MPYERSPEVWAPLLAGAVVFFLLGVVAYNLKTAPDRRREYNAERAKPLEPCGKADFEADTFELRPGFRVRNLDSYRFSVIGPDGTVCSVRHWEPVAVTVGAP